MANGTWRWDPSLYSGSAGYYARGRLPYPGAIADALAAELHLDGTGRLLDIGCGPGSLTLPLAGRFGEAVGIDADGDMIGQADRLATEAGITNTRWLHLRAEDLPAGLGLFRLVTFAQSFHWMDRPTVAAIVRGMLEAGGACTHLHATTHRGTDDATGLPHPRPPHAAIADLVQAYLGPVRRAGQGRLTYGTAAGEDAIYRAAGFTWAGRVEVPGRAAIRVTDDVVAGVFSLSSSAPHLFGGARAEFEAELRRLLHDTAPDGRFSERTHEIAADIWRPATPAR